MRKKCIRCASACAATARTPRRPRRMPFLRSGAGSTASDRSHRFRRGSTVWRRTPALTAAAKKTERQRLARRRGAVCRRGRHLAPAAGDGRAPRGTEIIAGGPLRLAGGVPKGAHPARDRRPELHRDRRKRVDRAGHGQIAHQQGPITFAQLFIRKRELF